MANRPDKAALIPHYHFRVLMLLSTLRKIALASVGFKETQGNHWKAYKI